MSPPSSSHAAHIRARAHTPDLFSSRHAGGEDTPVTTGNREEYLQLYATHKLVGAVDEQVSAFREGLSVFVSDDLCATLRACCTVGEIRLLLCGSAEIDVDDWEQSARYQPAAYASSDQVRCRARSGQVRKVVRPFLPDLTLPYLIYLTLPDPPLLRT